jgi:hypothetical protein
MTDQRIVENYDEHKAMLRAQYRNSPTVKEAPDVQRVFPEWWPNEDVAGVDATDTESAGTPSLTDAEAPGVPEGSPAPASPLRWKSKDSRVRRGYTIHAYVGANGHGKSLAMMHDTKLSMDKGRPILSTVKILDPATGQPYRHYIPFRTWDQLLTFEGGDVLMDEIVGIAASVPGSQGLPIEVQLLLNQLRRRDILLRWTAPSWSRGNIVLREVTQAVTVCRGSWAVYEDRGDDSRLWGMNRLFRWTTYDAMELTQWTDSKEHKLKGVANAWFWRPGSWAEASYDTFDSVDNVDSGEGYCFNCGGKRPKRVYPNCTCGGIH